MARFVPLGRLATIGVVAAMLLSGLLRPLQTFVADQRFAIAQRPLSGSILLVDIDEPSIRAVGTWPWSRSVHATIVDKLRALGAAEIAFDVDFSSPSTPDGDAALEEALRHADGTVILAALQQAVRAGPGSAAGMMESRPLPRFAANGWEGSVNVWPDPDGRIRRFPRGEAFGTTVVPSLATLLGSGSGQTDGSYLIDFGLDARRFEHVSAATLLDGTVDPTVVRGRRVIVGATAVELRDFFTVPRFGLLPGATLQALAAESLLQERDLQEIGAPVTLAWTVLLLGIVGLGTRRMGYKRFLALCAGIAVLVEAGACVVQALRPLVAVTAPVHAGLAAFALMAVVTEIRERRLKLQRSRRSANRLRVILDRVIADNFAGIVVVDQDGLIRAISAAASAVLGPGAGGETRRYESVLPDALARLLTEAMAHALAGTRNPHATCEVACVLGAGQPAILECVTTVSDTLDPTTAGATAARDFAVCLTFQDVTAARAAQRQLAEMARVDALSGLANRYVYLDGIAALETRPTDETVAVLFFDLDRFKAVNDRLGHVVGDALIRAVAARVQTLLGPGDIAARLGGDEFALILARGSRDDAEAFAEALVHTIGGPYTIGSYQASIAVSVGLVFHEGQDGKSLMSAADAALYAAKTAGGGCVRLYDAAMQAMAEETRQLEQDLQDALALDQLRVVYQRQVDVEHERIIGVEALVRWTHPQHGPVSPARFIPIAERTGLIEPIGAWVLATACRDAAAWPVPIRVSVNLSAVQLARTGLAGTILATLADTGLAADRLELELTESLLMDDDEVVRQTLGDLRAAGIRISLDDFGTGYSSLSYLQSFAIDKVKIDQSFVRELAGGSAASTAIVRAVVGLARDLGIRVNAEGVETVEQLRLLRQLGCDEVQGYLHGRPEPSPAIRASLLGQQAPETLAYRAAS